MDGSSCTRGGKLHWKAAAYRPTDGHVLTKEGIDSSAQIAELMAVKLVIDFSLQHAQQIVRIFSD